MVLWDDVFVGRWLEKPLEVAEDGDVFDDSSTDGELVLPPEYVDLPADIGYLETEENLVLPPEYEGLDGQRVGVLLRRGRPRTARGFAGRAGFSCRARQPSGRQPGPP